LAPVVSAETSKIVWVFQQTAQTQPPDRTADCNSLPPLASNPSRPHFEHFFVAKDFKRDTKAFSAEIRPATPLHLACSS